MGILLKLSAIVLQPLIGDTGTAVATVAAQFFIDRFTNHSTRLLQALRRANADTWRALEFALAEDALLDGLARADDRAFRDQVRGFLKSVELGFPADSGEDFRRRCLAELQAARQAGLLDTGELNVQSLAREAGAFVEFAEPSKLLDGEWQALQQVAAAFDVDRYPSLVQLLGSRPKRGSPMLVAAARYFFRREVIKDPELSREHVFDRLEALWERQQEGLVALGDQIGQLRLEINRLLETRHLARRPLTAGDSMSFRDEDERRVIRQLIDRYRALPAHQRREWPDLLGGVGKLEVVAGNAEAAQKDFQALAGLTDDPATQAEAFHNAYLAALEARDWAAGLQQLLKAHAADPTRFAPLPIDKYRPERILGAGGFGVAFLCRDLHVDRPVVVKSLLLEGAGHDSDAILAEARAISRIEHPAVVKLIDCDYMDRAARARPYLVMEYFAGDTLAEHVRRHGPLNESDFLAVARAIAEALEAAHRQDVLHRDVKPANVLVRRAGDGWQVRLIDFGLALRQSTPRAATRDAGSHTLARMSIAGTLEYGAPEQLGRLPSVPVGRPADIYGFAKTCCYALFGTAQPMLKHWRELKPHLEELLEQSLAEDPGERPQDFAEVLRGLAEPAEAIGDAGRARILDHFQKRLSAAISRSPLLKLSMSRSARILDVSRLRSLRPELPVGLVTAVIDSKPKITLDLRQPPAPLVDANNSSEEADSDRLHELLERRIRRQAELARRETGVHALWLGYPLLYAAAGGTAERWALAPLFLWPINIDTDARLEKHLRIARATDPEAPRFNRVLSLWVQREFGVRLHAPNEDEIQQLDRATLQGHLDKLASQFSAATVPPLGSPLQAVPERTILQQGSSPLLVNAAVLGYFRWQNEAVLADLEAIQERDNVRGVVRTFVTTAALPQPPDAPAPAEEAQYLVSDTDFSQERVVWQARSGPGLVVHGPPGTGKSQTIVNVIADTLARNQTVLMVCQKQAATRVVMERLRAAGLADLCLEIHDAELDRKAVFQAIRAQVENLRSQFAAELHQRWQDIADKIDALQRDLNRHAQAFHRQHPRLGLSYREMMDQEQRAYCEFPAARPLQTLQRILEAAPTNVVEDACRRAREVGRWFAEGDALHNPWRFARFDNIQLLGLLRAEIATILRQLRSQDADHVSHVREHGVGTPLPANLPGFSEVGTEVLQRLRAIAAAQASSVIAWLPTLRSADANQRQELLVRCRQAFELADQVQATPLDAYWTDIANKTPDFLGLAEGIIRRLDAHGNRQIPETNGLLAAWVRAVRGASDAAIEQQCQRCRAAQELARRVAGSTHDETWAAIHRHVRGFVEIVAPVIERLQALAQSSSTGVITQAWLKQMRDGESHRIQQFRVRCQEAVSLSQRVKSMPAEPRWVQVSSTDELFLTTAAELLDRLDHLERGAAICDTALVGAWLGKLRQTKDEDFQRYFAECREAVRLARKLADTPVDRTCEEGCSAKTLLELRGLRAQVDEFLRRSRNWFRFLDATYGRARRALLQLSPNADEEQLAALAESLLAYIQLRHLAEELAALNRRILPEHAPPPDDVSQRKFPERAAEALAEAAWFIRLEREHAWCRPIVDELLQPLGARRQQTESLRTSLDGMHAAKQLEQVNESLVPEFRLRLDARGLVKYPAVALKALEHAAWLFQEKREHPFLAELIETFARQRMPGALGPVQTVRQYLELQQLAKQLAQVNERLVPGHRADGMAVDASYTFAAVEAHQAAVWLLRSATTHCWITALLDELVTEAGQPARLRNNLRGFLQASRLRMQLAVANQKLPLGALPAADEGAQTRFAREAYQGFQEAARLCALARENRWVNPLLEALLARDDPTRLNRSLHDVQCALQRSSLVQVMLESMRRLRAYLKDEGLREPYAAIRSGGSVREWAAVLENGLDGLQALVSLAIDRQDRSGLLGEAINALEEYEKGLAAGLNVPSPGALQDPTDRGRWWAALVRCSAASAWQLRCRSESPELVRITPDIHASKVGELAVLLEQKRGLVAELVRDRWLERQQQHRSEPWNRMFQERSSKHGSSKSLREAIELSWDTGLPTLRPCWLVNPASASQIFPLHPGLFDLVIFDEASQCPVEQAIAAIYRGKRLVVCGDEKQLPPTAFFAASADLDDDSADAEEAEAAESPAEPSQRRQRRAEEDYLMQASDLLEAAIGKLKRLYLSVHYRSDHPALIEFSNRAFYKGQLEAPPSQRASVEGARPIDYHAVNGCYENRTNLAEAQYIIALLRRHWIQSSPAPSLGVVTFNQAQRDLVENAIEEACVSDGEFCRRYQEECERREGNQDIGFFVKNLENVQGDERDVMIFSTTFGPDAQGRFYRRFGPVAAAGGHRRLNVAVTRARRQVIIASSMPIQRIADALAGGTVSELTPAGYLQLYLAYAEAVSTGNEPVCRMIKDRLSPSPVPAGRRQFEETAIQADIRSVITEWGFRVRSGLGDAVFRIDLGVLHSDATRGYILGIECDGGVWLDDRSVRIREVWRPRVLTNRGWRLYRIWSTRWWSERAKEIQRLRAALETALAS
jgi:serine/threonine protein kinase